MTLLAAKPVAPDNDYASIQLAAKAAGAPLTTNRVVMIMVFPTFVDARIAATGTSCRVSGVATRPDTSLVWSPRLPAQMANTRFVGSTRRSITVDIKTTAGGPWQTYTASSPSTLHWTAGTVMR